MYRTIALMLAGTASCAIIAAGSAAAVVPSATAPSAHARAIAVPAKLKCGFDDEGNFSCKNVKRKQGDEGSSGHSDSGYGGGKTKNKGTSGGNGSNSGGTGSKGESSGSESTGSGNSGGSSTSTSSGGSKGSGGGGGTTPGSGKGQCFTVETTQTGKISCTGEFSAQSCGAVQNGMITCCCVR